MEGIPRLAVSVEYGKIASAMIAYLNGNYLAKDAIHISPEDRGFLFGDGVYEVIRVYQGRPFQAEAHFARLQHSLHGLQLAPVNVTALREVAQQLLIRNGLETSEALVYIQITRGAAPRQHAFPAEGTPPTLFAAASPCSAPVAKRETGVKVIVMPDIRWARCDIKCIAMAANVLASQRAVERGAEEAVLVRDGVVTEGSHSNFAAVFKGELRTHAKTNHILPGVTREVVLKLCQELGIPVREAPVWEHELYQADEAMLLSSNKEVMPVVQVDDWRVGEGKPGPVTRRLQQAFRALVQR